jgi:hypothetical protein
MDELMREILTEIQAGKSAFRPAGSSHQAIMEFQATAKRIEAAQRRGYIRDAKQMQGSLAGDAHVVVLSIAISGGLTLEGEGFLLGDDDDRAF